MAANFIDPGSSLAELATTIDLLQVPDKLHCTTCKKFLLNAFRTSCCESYLCETCFDQLSDQCPACAHKPFSQDLVRPNKAMRGTAKAYLKAIEKAQAEERAKAQTILTPDLSLKDPFEAVIEAGNITQFDEFSGEETSRNPPEQKDPSDANVQPSIETGSPAPLSQSNESIEPAEISDAPRQHSPNTSAGGNDDEEEEDDEDEITIQVDPIEGEGFAMHHHMTDIQEEETGFQRKGSDDHQEQLEETNDASNGQDSDFNNMANMNMGYNMNMQPLQMMQQMQQMMMNNPMMGAMGMNPSMFGGFQNESMNGMDMSMMGFNPSQNMFGWNGQNGNFSNPYSNAMGGNFASSFGFDMSQQGNFQQQFHNGDFQNGYSDYRGRGRGRYRGGRGSFRGRGHFNQYTQSNPNGFHNAYDRPQQDVYSAQRSMQDYQNDANGALNDTDVKEEPDHGNDNFAPGGQDEVQEALGDDYNSAKTGSDAPEPLSQTVDSVQQEQEMKHDDMETNGVYPEAPAQQISVKDKGIPEAYHEDFDNMAPPTAPSGPSGRFNDFGFRSRGRGRYGHHSRNSFSYREPHLASPVKPVSQTSIVAQSSPGKGLGVQGAPTGPKAMRDPTVPKSTPRVNAGGFQIKGQAAAQAQTRPQENTRSRSSSPNGYGSNDERSHRTSSKYDRYSGSKYDDLDDISHDRSDRERKRKRSRRDADDEYDFEETNGLRSRAESPSRKSRRTDRHDRPRDRDREKSSSKHHSTQHQVDEEGDEDYGVDGYRDLADTRSPHHKSSYRSGKSSSKYDDRDREKERDRDTYKDRSRDRDERHRKRSRHDRDRGDDYDEPDEEESRHRSRRHKKEHHSSSKRDRDRDRDREHDKEADANDKIGLRISGRASSNRHTAASALPTPTSAVSAPSESEKDPHTLEREARNRERMLKEQQRREKAAADKKGTGAAKHGRGTVSGGRRVSYKYEDEIERGMDEREQRWR